jgi:hypothetical protein
VVKIGTEVRQTRALELVQTLAGPPTSARRSSGLEIDKQNISAFQSLARRWMACVHGPPQPRVNPRDAIVTLVLEQRPRCVANALGQLASQECAAARGGGPGTVQGIAPLGVGASSGSNSGHKALVGARPCMPASVALPCSGRRVNEAQHGVGARRAVVPLVASRSGYRR